MTGPRLVVLGWDSATFDVVDPMIQEGRLPALQSLMERGVRADLRSTWPPMTDCAWTGAFTGVGAGTHGIFGSWYRAPGAYAPRYFSSRDRRAPALWEMVAGVRFLVWNVPMTFPPTPVQGVMVSGYAAPPGSRFCNPEEIQDELARRWPLDDLLDRVPHASLEGFLDDLVRGLEAQAEALPWALRRSAADCGIVVWPHVDRAQHFFWSFRGTSHPLANAVERVYEAMDRATEAVVESFPDADVLVVSDHGAGPLHGDVNVAAWLARNRHATPKARRRLPLVELAWKMPPRLRKLGRRLAPGVAGRAMGATLAGGLGGFDWSRTHAFFGFHGDLWLNLRDREPQGAVRPEDADPLLGELIEGLLAIEDPTSGARVFGGAHRRVEVFGGPADALAPDAILDSWSVGYRVAPGRAAGGEVVVAPAPLAGVQAAWSADHRPVGILAGAGPRVAWGDLGELSLLDVCPTALALLGCAVPDGLEGRAAAELIAPDHLARHPITVGAAAAGRAAGGTYSDEEAAAVAEHLKDLGYIE